MGKPEMGKPLDNWELDVPTTADDVEALRRIREERRQVPVALTEELLRALSPPDWLPRPPRRTFEGWEPFEL